MLGRHHERDVKGKNLKWSLQRSGEVLIYTMAVSRYEDWSTGDWRIGN